MVGWLAFAVAVFFGLKFFLRPSPSIWHCRCLLKTFCLLSIRTFKALGGLIVMMHCRNWHLHCIFCKVSQTECCCIRSSDKFFLHALPLLQSSFIWHTAWCTDLLSMSHRFGLCVGGQCCIMGLFGCCCLILMVFAPHCHTMSCHCYWFVQKCRDSWQIKWPSDFHHMLTMCARVGGALPHFEHSHLEQFDRLKDPFEILWDAWR